VREGYIQSVAGTLGIDHAWFKEAILRGGQRRPAWVDDEVRPSRRQVDRRELDALRWAIHEPQLVADWLEPALFADPDARAACDLLMSSSTFREALDTSEGPVRGLLERVAVEDATVDGDPTTLRARLLVNMATPAGDRLLASLLESGDDERASQVKSLLDRVAHERDAGEWEAAQQAAKQLVGWLVDRPQDATAQE
jgi:hypothetical protein